MKRKTMTTALLLASVLACAPGLAADYFVRYHHTAEAYGKEVERVLAHTGILCVSWLYQGRTYWTEIADVPLTRADGRFTGSRSLPGSSAKFADYCEQPVVQYWVDFKDGTSMISSVHPIRCAEQVLVDHQSPSAAADYEGKRAALAAELSSSASSVQSTGCKLLAYTNVDPYE